jgi:hypothetical protein
MKRILLIGCVLLSAGAYAQVRVPAQMGTGKAAVTTLTVSKSDFEQRVKQMNDLLAQNKTQEAKAAWDEIHFLIRDEFGLVKQKILESEENNNASDQTKYNTILDNQIEVYNAIIKYRDNLQENKALLYTRLLEYNGLML